MAPAHTSPTSFGGFSFSDALEIAHSPFTLGLSYSVRQRSDGQWAVIQLAVFIDRHGEKDGQEDTASLWATQFEARAEANRLSGLEPLRRVA
jgi:hypothetical protein